MDADSRHRSLGSKTKDCVLITAIAIVSVSELLCQLFEPLCPHSDKEKARRYPKLMGNKNLSLRNPNQITSIKLAFSFLWRKTLYLSSKTVRKPALYSKERHYLYLSSLFILQDPCKDSVE